MPPSTVIARLEERESSLKLQVEASKQREQKVRAQLSALREEQLSSQSRSLDADASLFTLNRQHADDVGRLNQVKDRDRGMASFVTYVGLMLRARQRRERIGYFAGLRGLRAFCVFCREGVSAPRAVTPSQRGRVLVDTPGISPRSLPNGNRAHSRSKSGGRGASSGRDNAAMHQLRADLAECTVRVADLERVAPKTSEMRARFAKLSGDATAGKRRVSDCTEELRVLRDQHAPVASEVKRLSQQLRKLHRQEEEAVDRNKARQNMQENIWRQQLLVCFDACLAFSRYKRLEVMKTAFHFMVRILVNFTKEDLSAMILKRFVCTAHRHVLFSVVSHWKTFHFMASERSEQWQRERRAALVHIDKLQPLEQEVADLRSKGQELKLEVDELNKQKNAVKEGKAYTTVQKTQQLRTREMKMQVARLDHIANSLDKERESLSDKDKHVTKRQKRLKSDNQLLENKSRMLGESEQQMTEANRDLERLMVVEDKYRRLMVRLVFTQVEVLTLERVEGINRSVMADALKVWKRFLLVAFSNEYNHHKREMEMCQDNLMQLRGRTQQKMAELNRMIASRDMHKELVWKLNKELDAFVQRPNFQGGSDAAAGAETAGYGLLASPPGNAAPARKKSSEAVERLSKEKLGRPRSRTPTSRVQNTAVPSAAAQASPAKKVSTLRQPATRPSTLGPSPKRQVAWTAIQ